MNTTNASEIIKSILAPFNNLQLGEFNLASACSTFVIQFYDSNRKRQYLLKKFIKFLFFKNNDHKNLYRLFKNNPADNLVTFSTSRKSHEKLLKQYINLLGVKDKHVIFNFKEKIRFSSNFVSFFITIKYCYQNKIRITFSLNSLCIFLSIFELVINKRELDKYFNGFYNKFNYICLNSAWGIENIYTQFFKSKGCKTFTFQHAAFCDFDHALPIELNNYKNISSDYFLAWGKYTTDEISKYFPKDLKTLYIGNPVVEDFHNTIMPNDLKPHKNSILLALPRNYYISEISNLFTTLGSDNRFYKYNFIIRLHPSLSKKECLKLISPKTRLSFKFDNFDTIYETLINVKPVSIISFNSSIIFELLNLSKLINVYISKRNDFFIKELKNFKNSLEFFLALDDNKEIHLNKKYFFDNRDLEEIRNLLKFK